MSQTTVILDGLLRQLRDGNETVRRQLLDRAYGRLVVLARGKLRAFPRVSETGDVLHPALLDLDRALKAVHPDTPRQFYAMAAKHIRWVLLDLARVRRPDASPEDAVDSSAGPATLAQEADLHANLHRAVESLPPDLQAVVDLLYYQDLKVAEAAEVLAVSDRTVKKRWRDARLALVRTLGEGPTKPVSTHTPDIGGNEVVP